MPDSPAAHRFRVRHPVVEAIQWDESDVCVMRLLERGAPVTPAGTPDGGWMLKSPGTEAPSALLFPGVWVVNSGGSWEAWEPAVFDRMYVAE
ncbi:hypothetical protein AB0M12_38725 [Nocardia vinacea]|uniref:hypothetical protein n=1 Tax=Nocardia vinacea TaxID=96468 RepID=UPI0034319174